MTILERINKHLKPEYGFEATDPEQNFRDNLDSLDYLEFIIIMEEEFDIEIPLEDYENGQLDTVGQAVAYLEKRLAEKEAHERDKQST